MAAEYYTTKEIDELMEKTEKNIIGQIDTLNSHYVVKNFGVDIEDIQDDSLYIDFESAEKENK